LSIDREGKKASKVKALNSGTNVLSSLFGLFGVDLSIDRTSLKWLKYLPIQRLKQQQKRNRNRTRNQRTEQNRTNRTEGFKYRNFNHLRCSVPNRTNRTEPYLVGVFGCFGFLRTRTPNAPAGRTGKGAGMKPRKDPSSYRQASRMEAKALAQRVAPPAFMARLIAAFPAPMGRIFRRVDRP
jgi:hypothetical protein